MLAMVKVHTSVGWNRTVIAMVAGDNNTPQAHGGQVYDLGQGEIIFCLAISPATSGLSCAAQWPGYGVITLWFHIVRFISMNPLTKSTPPQIQGLSKAKVLVCESNGMIRQAIRIGLNNLGIREIIEAHGFVGAHKALEQGGFDAVVINAELEGHDTFFLLREVRLGRLGPDPFIVSMLLLSAPEPSRLTQAVDSGTDDLLLIPFSPDQLSTRLNAFRARRKPFVVTHDYLGPDRRKGPRPGGQNAVTVDAPNPLAARAIGIPFDRYEKLRQQACRAIGTERIKRLAAATEWECRSMLNAAAAGNNHGDLTITGMFKLETLLTELAERAGQLLQHDGSHLHEMMNRIRDAKNRVGELKLADFDSLHLAARRITVTYTGG